MKRFYATSISPSRYKDATWMKETLQEALDAAKTCVRNETSDGLPHYVVQILFKVERDTPPVKVTKVKATKS